MALNVHEDNINVIWEDSKDKGFLKEEYWRFQIKSGNPFVGMTTKSFFGQGWFMRGENSV